LARTHVATRSFPVAHQRHNESSRETIPPSSASDQKYKNIDSPVGDVNRLLLQALSVDQNQAQGPENIADSQRGGSERRSNLPVNIRDLKTKIRQSEESYLAV
jgi:hypothetical protein